MSRGAGRYRVGLTGGIGSGKSTVAGLFAELDVTIIDSDLISHQLTRSGGDAIGAIRSTFGETYISADGGLNRARMRQLVFSDMTAKNQLETILHPLIRAQMLAQEESSADASPYLMLVIPLLFETANYLGLVQRKLVVDCSETTQISRTMQRSGLTEQEVRAIMARQISREDRLLHADDIIRNEAELDSLREQVGQMHQRYINLSVASCS